ncbi:predicted protein [Postia placenta Mad-698-R]|nr:predicted protein [Postia placenta Mad-698-R]
MAGSDLIGRKAAFNATLFLTSVFGVLASFANTFVLLCVALFFLGSAVGGSMPTDGTLLLEHMPNGKQYLVTALSVFFSFGSVLSAVVGLLVIPGHSCRQQEALESLQLIARFNGDDLDLGLQDVQDHAPAAVLGDGISASPTRITHDTESAFGNPDQDSSALVFHADSTDGDVAEVARRSLSSARSRDMLRSASESDSKNYDAMGESNVPLDGHQYDTLPRRGSTYHVDSSRMHDETDEAKEPLVADPVLPSPTEQRTPRLRPGYQERISQRMSTTSSMYEARSKLYWKLPRRVRKPVWAFVDRIAMVLSPEWMHTTLLVWAAWFAMSLAYTMFNVYLPKLFEGRGASDITATTQNSLEDSLWDVVIYAVGGCPGAILGAYLIESPLGRRWSLAGSTFATAFFCVIFVWVEQSWAVRASTVGIGLSATAMWAVLYGWTPEMFGTKVRGSACGIASALSRIEEGWSFTIFERRPRNAPLEHDDKSIISSEKTGTPVMDTDQILDHSAQTALGASNKLLCKCDCKTTKKHTEGWAFIMPKYGRVIIPCSSGAVYWHRGNWSSTDNEVALEEKYTITSLGTGIIIVIRKAKGEDRLRALGAIYSLAVPSAFSKLDLVVVDLDPQRCFIAATSFHSSDSARSNIAGLK